MDEFEREIELIRSQGIKSSPLRMGYEREVAALRTLPEKLRSEGYDEEQIARIMHGRRRKLGRLFKEAAPPLFREYIYAATAAKYGDPLGPAFEMLRERKSCQQIIESSSRPIEDLDDRLTLDGFVKWCRAQKGESKALISPDRQKS